MNILSKKVLEHILDFHVRFEQIHPFQDGNGRVGRLIMFKECLANGIVPFIITEELKLFYYRGLHEWGHINGFLTDTCLTAQDQYKSLLDYFRITYKYDTNFAKDERTVLILKDDDAKIKQAGRNIPNLSFLAYNRLEAHTLFYGRKVIILESAVKNLSDFYAEDKEAK